LNESNENKKNKRTLFNNDKFKNAMPEMNSISFESNNVKVEKKHKTKKNL
jgi:hypothetical protein